MEILLKLRLSFWVLVLALWGSIIYQFLGDDSRFTVTMLPVANPFPRKAPAAARLFPARPRPVGEAEPSAPPGSPPAAPDRILVSAPPPGQFIKPLPPRNRPPLAKGVPAVDFSVSLRRHEDSPQEAALGAPAGFHRTHTRHFVIYSEKEPAPRMFLETVENLHGNLMLDLAAFSPWARDEKVSIFLFRSQDHYRRVTGRPAWSGGASSVSKRKIYLYESEELIGILAHELCHIYFDGFFLGSDPNPLWLSEGMATLVQVERGLVSPNWLPENLDTLYRGGGFRLQDLIRVENTAGANDDNVRLWYTQSYSIVRFLLRSRWKSSFYRFCSYLREGRPTHEALYRAYGMPFNRIKALEYAWRYDIETHRITSLRLNP